MLFNEDIYPDLTSTTTLPYVGCQCYYDANLKLLLLMADNPYSLPSVKTLWLNILKACHLKDWVALFSGKNPNTISYHKILLHPQGLERLQRHFQVKHTWYIGPKQSWLPVEVLVTQGFMEWEQLPLIKKQVWLKWLSLIN